MAGIPEGKAVTNRAARTECESPSPEVSNSKHGQVKDRHTETDKLHFPHQSNTKFHLLLFTYYVLISNQHIILVEKYT